MTEATLARRREPGRIGRRILVASFALPVSPRAIRVARDGLVTVGVILAVLYWWLLTNGPRPVDATGWYLADPGRLYSDVHAGLNNRYMYSPAFEFVMVPLRTLDIAVFSALWRAAQFLVLAWLAGPFLGFVLFLLPVASELNAGNIQLFLALLIVAGFRYPGTWAGLILTKATLGLGLLWFLLRREWRALGIALGVTATIAGVSFILHPGLWRDWLVLLTANPAPAVSPYFLTFWVRAPVAVLVIAWGALTNHRWALVVGTTLALPVVYFVSASMLVGVLPYVRRAAGRAITSWFGAREAWRSGSFASATE